MYLSRRFAHGYALATSHPFIARFVLQRRQAERAGA